MAYKKASLSLSPEATSLALKLSILASSLDFAMLPLKPMQLVFETENGAVVRFVASKTRVAPLKTQMIPRLELLASVLLARLVTAVSSSLKPILPQF